VVQREAELKIQREFLGLEPASERAERLASLLTLSHEPMLAWRLDGPIDFWNTGAARLYGFAPEEAVGPTATLYCKQNFRSNLPISARNFAMGVTGPASCGIFARTAAKSP
jgi:PAS domain-containing protein